MIALLFAAHLAATQDSSGLTLVTAVRHALASYPTVAAARAARDRSAAELGEARSTRLPRLQLDAGATRYQEPTLVYPLHGFPSPATPGPAPIFERTLIQGSAMLNWTLFDFGQRQGRVRAARALVAAAEASLGSVELALAQRTATAYLRVLTARQTLAAQDERLAALTAESARIGRLLAEGRAARIERLRVEAERSRGAADRIGIAAQLDVAERELAQLIGLPWEAVHARPLAAAALRDTAFTDTARAPFVMRAGAASPELAEARRRAEAARLNGAAVRATRLPELRLQTGVVDRGHGGGGFTAEWQAGLQVSYALWTGGGRASQIRRADAEFRGATEQVRIAELAAAQAVDRALAAVHEARARVTALADAVTQSEEVAAIERTSLDIGSGTQTDYLDAVAGLLRARASLIEARHAEIAAHIDLARVTGELSPAWIAGLLR